MIQWFQKGDPKTMPMKKIIDPRTGNAFFLIEDGKPYSDVLPASFIEGSPEAIQQAAQDYVDPFALKHTTALKKKIKRQDRVFSRVKAQLRALETRNKELLKYKDTGFVAASNFILGLVYIVAIGLLFIIGLILL